MSGHARAPRHWAEEHASEARSAVEDGAFTKEEVLSWLGGFNRGGGYHQAREILAKEWGMSTVKALLLAGLFLLAAPLSAQLETDAFTSVAVDIESRDVVPFGVGGQAGYGFGSLTVSASASWSPINGHATRATIEVSATSGPHSRMIVFIGDTNTSAPEDGEEATDEADDYGVSVGDFNTLGFGFRASNDGGGFIEVRLNRVEPMDDARWSLEFRLSP